MQIRIHHSPDGGPLYSSHLEGSLKLAEGAAIVPHNFRFEELILEITSIYSLRSFY